MKAEQGPGWSVTRLVASSWDITLARTPLNNALDLNNALNKVLRSTELVLCVVCTAGLYASTSLELAENPQSPILHIVSTGMCKAATVSIGCASLLYPRRDTIWHTPPEVSTAQQLAACV